MDILKNEDKIKIINMHIFHLTNHFEQAKIFLEKELNSSNIDQERVDKFNKIIIDFPIQIIKLENLKLNMI